MNVFKNLPINVVKKFAPLFSVPYEAQLTIKQLRTVNAIKFYNSLLRKSYPEFPEKLICEIESIQKSPVVDGYKNRMESVLKLDNEDFAQKSFKVPGRNYKKPVFSDICKELNRESQLLIIEFFKNYLNEESKLNTLLQGRGSWLKLIIRSNRADDSLMNIMVSCKNPSTDLVSSVKEELIAVFLPRLVNEHINVRSLFWNLRIQHQPDQSSSIKIWGNDHISETICGKLIRITDKSVFEVNTDAVEVKCQVMKRLIEEEKSKDLQIGKKILILDLFCKIGTFGIVLSNLASKVIGVDNDSACIEEAKCNVSVNDFSNVVHVCDDVEHYISNFLLSGEESSYDEIIAIVQTSGQGIGSKVCLQLRQLKGLKTILFSTSSLVGEPISNLFSLCKKSESPEIGSPFTVTKACPVDSLPHTRNVDTILKLIRLNE